MIILLFVLALVVELGVATALLLGWRTREAAAVMAVFSVMSALMFHNQFGDKGQLVPLIEGAIRHGGAAFIDVISPCVAFNNHPGSTKSYDYVREHNESVSRIDFISARDEITLDAAPGEVADVRQHDGTLLRLRSLHEGYDATDRHAALNFMQAHQARGEVVTGLLYVDPLATDLHTALNTSATALNALDATRLCPGAAALDRLNASLR